MRNISPLELQAYLVEAPVKPLLLDVRESHEFAYCHIEGSKHIPMHELPARIHELDHEQEIVLICHHGIRSRMAGNYLGGHNFQRLLNLSGGVAEWARTVDGTMPRY